MRATALAIALLMSGAAVAQTTTDDTTTNTTDTAVETDVTATQTDTGVTSTPTNTNVSSTQTSDMSTQPATTMASTMPASGAVMQPSNANPEEDARGIAVISDPAMVPAGWNGIASTAMGGPLVDPATGETVSGSDNSYPPCTASRTDNCLQTYERGRAR